MAEQYPEYVEKIVELQVAKGQEPERLDVYITNAIANATRNKVQNAIDQGDVTVNDCVKKGSYKIKPGDVIVCKFMRPPPLELLPQDIPLHILYEDEDVMVINKPSGLVVHPGFGNRYGTLVNAVLWHMGYREAIPLLVNEDDELDSFQEEKLIQDTMLHSSLIRPGIVHRLDKDTSGIMVISKSQEMTPLLTKQFADRTVEREYCALTWGLVKQDHAIIETMLAPSPRNRKVFAVSTKEGKLAKTEYWTLCRSEFASLVRIKLHTGRTHQIRVHFSHIHHPLIGDTSYGGDKIAYSGLKSTLVKSKATKCLEIMPHQALHARSLGFTHPRTGMKLKFSAPPEDIFLKTAHLAGITLPDDFLN